MLGMQGIHQNLIKIICSKYVTYDKLNGERHKAILLKLGTRQECLLSPYLFSIVLEFIDRAMQQLKEIKRVQIWKGIRQSIAIYRWYDSN